MHSSSRRVSAGAVALSILALLTVFALAERTQSATASSGGVTHPDASTSPTVVSGKLIFPIRARHQYWGGFGDGRGHQGADVGARCGAPLVATQAGRVQLVDTHSAAGNYVVIDIKRKPYDYVYMHLATQAKVREGQAVSAGQYIGPVGDTGRAYGCHLHFELWSGDYYGGGAPVDPVPYLKRVDRTS